MHTTAQLYNICRNNTDRHRDLDARIGRRRELRTATYGDATADQVNGLLYELATRVKMSTVTAGIMVDTREQIR